MVEESIKINVQYDNKSIEKSIYFWYNFVYYVLIFSLGLIKLKNKQKNSFFLQKNSIFS